MDRPDQESALSSITLCNLSALTKNLGIPLESVPDLVAGISSKVGSRGVLLAVAFVFEEMESAIWFDDKDHPVRAAKNLGIPLESVPDLVTGISSKVGSRGVLLAVAFVFEEMESAIWFDDKDHPARAAKNLGIPLESVPDLVAGIGSKVGSRGGLLAVAFVFEEVESSIWVDDKDHPARAAKNLGIPLESVPDLVAGIGSKVGS